MYEAIKADEPLMEIIGGRVTSTCFEIPPDMEDNTDIPNIIITDDGFQNQIDTKDYVWEGAEDQVQVTVDIGANSPSDVKTIMRKVRKAIETYMVALTDSERPELIALTSDGLAWDWMKPCYYQKLTYQCIISADIEADEQEEN